MSLDLRKLLYRTFEDSREFNSAINDIKLMSFTGSDFGVLVHLNINGNRASINIASG